ncbi:MAG TPA: hypothetical protein VIL30_20860 [Ramlibacter sp.]|jgi:hypothetical protein
MNLLAAFLASAAVFLAASASAQQPAAGTYVREGGSGTLQVREGGAFTLESLGANGHTCTLDGTVLRGRAATAEGCAVRFERKAGAIQVAPEGKSDAARDACRAHCGMRAHFEGDYFPQPAACRNASVAAERAAFLVDYKAKRFQPAATRLQKLLDACGRLLWWMTDAEVRNDLALAQHRAGDGAACLATLKPLEPLLRGDQHFPPLEKDWADGVLPQIRFNRKLCEATPRR